MASTINPNNIDGTYPVAGQDNDSQGFRDNFTNIKTNFSYAAAEITDIQNKAIFKSALTGTTLNNDMGGSILSNAQLQDMSETEVNLGSVSGTQTINYAAGPYYTLVMAGNISLQFTNFSVAGTTSRCRLQVNINQSDIGYTLTLPSAVTNGISNIQGINLTTKAITFNKGGVYEFEFETSDAGATISIFDLNRNHDPIYLPSAEDLANGATANINLTTSYFSTSTAETALLPAGANGQIKVFAMSADAGDMVITVNNAGWKTSGSGTITFDTIGDACTLLYTNSKWYCIGNNGATFA
jgi:hypothetical protein